MALGREDLIGGLNELIQACRDGNNGFGWAAAHTDDPGLQSFFKRCSQQRLQFSSELQAEVRELGGPATENGSVSGAFNRGWMNLEAAAAGGDDALLVECEWGEESALRNYERVLKKNLPPHLLPLVKHQYTQIKNTLIRIRDVDQAA